MGVEAATVADLIAGGESSNLEFKSTLRFDLKAGNVNKALEHVVAKTLAAYLNTTGGVLLIGVGDDGAIVGLDYDVGTLSSKNLDAFERTLRAVLSKYLGVEITPSIHSAFVEVEGHMVAYLECAGHHVPVFLTDGDKQQFFVRDGNATKPLGVKSAHAYMSTHWPTDQPVTRADVHKWVTEAMVGTEEAEAPSGSPFAETEQTLAVEEVEVASEAQVAEPIIGVPPAAPIAGQPRDLPPPWLKVGTRRVLDLFLAPLARSERWQRLYIISPWISDIADDTSMTFGQMVNRISGDRATVYVVTRPPQEHWHRDAIRVLGETTRANIALVPNLHVKLYFAQTASGSFALLGSANFTQQALANRELGLLVSAFGQGRRVVASLSHEAAEIYRIPDRTILYRAKF